MPGPAVSVPDAGAASHRAAVVATLLVFGVTVVFAALLYRVAWLQANPPERVEQLVGTQRSVIPLSGRRGDLLDRNGQVLATTAARWRLFADPSLIEDHGSFPEQVAMALGLDPADVSRRVYTRPNSRYVVLDPDMNPDLRDAVRALSMRAVGTQVYARRDYPHGPLAGHLLGVAGEQGGGMGAELALEHLLAPVHGHLTVVRDARRRPILIPESGFQPPRDGHDVRLSIDVNIQKIAQRHLYAACLEYGAVRGQAIVMDPYTGEVLAMANYPAMDPSDLGATSPDLWRNAAVTDPFEPGSIFKPFVWSMLTEAGVAELDERFDTGHGSWRTPFGRTLRDAQPNGERSWEGVLVRSSNIGMAQAALRANHGWLHDAVKKFGFGRRTGIGLPGESGGIVTDRRQWSNYTQTSVPMGHEIAATPLQLVTAFTRLANGGIAVPATLRPVNRDITDWLEKTYPRVLSEPMAAHTRRVLRSAVMEGTGRALRDSEYAIWGKTGTAQVPYSRSMRRVRGASLNAFVSGTMTTLADHVRPSDVRLFRGLVAVPPEPGRGGGYEPGAYVASFIGGAPVSRPRVVAGVFVHRPDPDRGYFGSIVAAPAVRDILEQSLDYLGVAPSRNGH